MKMLSKGKKKKKQIRNSKILFITENLGNTWTKLLQ